MVSSGNPVRCLNVVDNRWIGLQRSRIILYKSRMKTPGQALRDQFFASLEDAAQLLRLFDFLPNVFLYVKDTQGRFVAMNQQLARLRGAESQHELIGKTDLELHPVYWGRRYQEEDRQVMESGREIPDLVWLVPAEDGKLGTFISSKIPIRGPDGAIIGIAGVMYGLESGRESTARVDPIQQASKLINEGFSGPLEIGQTAMQVGLSVSQLNRRFRAIYQMSPSEYLQRVRVHEASCLLADTDASISGVALETGFYDQAHLSRTFRRWMGMTPSEFRKEANK
jgi:AraC-like DNA-binding protein